MQVARALTTGNSGAAFAKVINAATRSIKGSVAYNCQICTNTLHTVLYGRLNLDRRLFKPVTYKNKTYMILKQGNPKQPLLVEFKKMLKDALIMLQREKVMDVNMSFSYKNDPENPIESYTLKFSLEENQDTCNTTVDRNTEQLQNRTCDLLDSVFKLDDNFGVLNPEDLVIRLIIISGDDIQPQTINKLKHSREEEKVGQQVMQRVAEKFPHTYTIGKLNTGHHRIKIKAKGEVYEPRRMMDTPKEEEEAEALPDAGISLNCLCDVSGTFDRIDMLKCNICSAYQHGVCLGYRSKEEFPKGYSCPKCNLDVGCPSAETACKRLAIALCYYYKAHPADLFHVEPFSSRRSLLGWFTSNKLLIEINDKLQVNFDIINDELMSKIYKKSPMNEDGAL